MVTYYYRHKLNPTPETCMPFDDRKAKSDQSIANAD